MNLTADIEEPESRSNSQQTSKQEQQSSASSSSSSSISQSASAPFATYSSASSSNNGHQQQQQVVPEFGMRNPPKGQSSSASSTQSDHQKAFDNYAAEQAQMAFEPISSAYKQSGSHSGVVTREFSPSVYRMSDSRQAVFENAHNGNNGGRELMNAHESEQTYGQAATLSNEMDSPYYSKTTDSGSNPFAANGGENGGGSDAGFSPISMSVDEAFRKYFPSQKEQDGNGEQQQQQQQTQYQQSGDVFGQQQQSEQQQAPKTQYITTYASDASENVQQVCPVNKREWDEWMKETADGDWRSAKSDGHSSSLSLS